MPTLEDPKPFVVDGKHTKKRGRPPRITVPPVVETVQSGDPSTPFDDPPLPPAVNLQPDHARVPPRPKRTLLPADFMRYWLSIPKLERDEWFICYVYRGLPKCDVLQTLTDDQMRLIAQQKMRKPEVNIDKLTEPLDPENWRVQMLEKYGAGDYGLRLNDQHPSVKNTVCFSTVNAETGGIEFRDWDSYPPVLKPEEVVLTEEINQPYLRWARLKGLQFPDDPVAASAAQTANEETEQMATVVETMARQNSELTDKVVEMARERHTPVVNAPAAPDPAARAQMAAVETMAEAGKQGMKLMGDALSQAMSNQAKTSDPTQYVKDLLALTQSIHPPAPPNNAAGDALAFMKMQLEQQEKHSAALMAMQDKNFSRLYEMQEKSHAATVRLLEQRLEALEKKPGGTGGPSNDEDSLDRLLRMKEKLRDLEGDGPAETQDPPWMRLGEKVLDGLGETIKAVAFLRQNGAAPAVPEAVPELPAAVPPAPAPLDRETEERMNYAKKVHKPLVDAIKAGRSGVEFAAGLVVEAGEMPYDFLAGQGYDGVTRFLQSYPPLWQELIMPPIGTQALDKFINEFLDREKVKAAVLLFKQQAQTPSGPPRRGPVVNAN